MKKQKYILILSILGLLFAAPAFATQGINKQINYQGVLKTSGGVKVSDGDYDIVFKIYDALSSGNLLWTGTHTAVNGNAVTITDGIFSVLLGSGSGNTMTLDFNDDTYYLGVKIGADPEMTPRKRIGASGYAFNADKFGGFSTTTFLRIDSPSANYFTATSTTASIFPYASTTALTVSNGAWFTGELDVVGSIKSSEAYIFPDGATQSMASTPNDFSWQITSGSFNQNFSVATEDTIPRGVFFKTDGTKMYVAGNAGNDINEYNLSTAWDISTAVFSINFSIATEDTALKDVSFKPDGTKMYIVGAANDSVYEYNLSVAWDISTAVFSVSFSVNAQDVGPQSVFFKPDGTRMFVVGNAGNDINEYNLSTPWDISTAVFSVNFSVGAEETTPTGVSFKPDGIKMYISGNTGNDINEYNLSTPWSISTASFKQNFSIASEETAPMGIFIKPDGAKMYVAGNAGNDINEYNLGLVAMGNVGIGDTNPAYRLEVGGGDVNTTGGGYRDAGTCVAGTCASDRALKRNIEPLQNSLARILQLTPSTFEFIDAQYGATTTNYGLIAQEVEPIFPEWVVKRSDGYNAVRYGLNIQMHMLRAIQEQQTLINSLLYDAVPEQTNISVVSTPSFNKDSAGGARIKAGDESVDVVFENEYVYTPIVNITPITDVNFDRYFVSNISSKGFTIGISPAYGYTDVDFNWLAVAVNAPKLIVSDGSVLNYDDVVLLVNDTVVDTSNTNTNPNTNKNSFDENHTEVLPPYGEVTDISGDENHTEVGPPYGENNADNAEDVDIAQDNETDTNETPNETTVEEQSIITPITPANDNNLDGDSSSYNEHPVSATTSSATLLLNEVETATSTELVL